MCICVKYGTWNVSNYRPEDVQRLQQAGYSPLTARVLCARGLSTPELARQQLSCNAPLIDPFQMREMKQAADRVRLAVARREHIAVFGDYDVDGITATCLLTDFLRRLGAEKVTSYIPGRMEEGYGLNEAAIRFLYHQQVNLIVTVDCGITANEEALLCRRLGMDLVITDHHECKQALPQAVAVVDPHRKDRTYPHTDLSGVGIAFKLASAVCGDQEGLLERYADLVCLGLIADVMPLRGEIRTLVQRGLEALEHTRRPGIAALMKECGCLGQPVTTATIGYVLAPRINAAGRMGQVEPAIRLFLTEDGQEAARMAQALCRLNRERQKIEAEIYAQATAMLPVGAPPTVIVLASETWHQGVVGIVASRLSEEYGCPTFLICLDGDKGKASSRSYGGFPLFSALSALSPLLESFGGHELAAGFTISRENIDRFREKMTVLVERFNAAGAQSAALRVDCPVEPELLTLQNVQALEELEPCGSGCPSPVLYIDNLLVDQLTEVGGGKHLRLKLRYGDRAGQSLPCIFFSTTALRAAICAGDRVDIAFTPQINEFRGFRSVQLNLADIRPCQEQRQTAARELDLYERYCRDGVLTPEDADSLLPVRSEFVAVWRYLTANSRENCLQEELSCMSRKIIRASGVPVTMTRARVCLDVFAEQGLIALRRYPKYYSIRITSDGHKVNLDDSPIIRRLKHRKAGQS